MTIPTSGDPRRRDDRHLMERIAELRRRMREKGIQERRVDWRTLVKPPTQVWVTMPTGTDLVRRLVEPIKVLCGAARILVLSGPAPEPLAFRGTPMSTPGLFIPAVPLDRSDPPEVPLEWSLPAEGGAPMIKLQLYRRDGEVILNCRIPDLPTGQVRVDLREMSGRGSFRGLLADLTTGDIVVGTGAWTLRLTFTHQTPHLVRDIPLDIGALPGE